MRVSEPSNRTITMKFKKVSNLLVILFLTIIVFSCKTPQKEEFQNIRLPLYPTGYDIKKGYDKTIKCNYLIYKINKSFPAKDAVNFLVDEFNKMDVQENTGDGKGTMRWEAFDSRTGSWEKTEKPPARFVATWVGPKKERIFLLQLYYKLDSGKTDWQNILHVDCKVCKYFKEYESKEPPQNAKPL